MTQPRAFLGLDFGTTNASISYLTDDPRLAGAQVVRARDVLFEVDPETGQTSPRVPTLLAVDPEGADAHDTLTGWACWRRLRRAAPERGLLRRGRDYFTSVKSDLGKAAVYRQAFAPAFTTPEVVAGRILQDLLEESLGQLHGVRLADAHVTLTVPAALSEAARHATRNAAEMAGLEPEQVELIDEPVAALIDLLNDPSAAGLLGTEPRTIALYDYGGGTLDITVVRACFDPGSRTGLRVNTLAIPPYFPLGGDVVDRAVMERVVWPQIVRSAGVAAKDLPLELRQRIEDTFTPWIARGLKEALCRKEAVRRQRGAPRPPGGVEVCVRLPGGDSVADALPLTREFHMRGADFERVLAPLVTWGGESAVPRADLEYPVLLQPLVTALDIGRIEPSELDYVVLHGGGCRNPYVVDLLESCLADAHGLFPRARVLRTPDLEASVARGAAIAGYWKHARGERIVVPVIPEEIGVVTLSDRPVMLVEGGAPLPYPADGEARTAETAFAVPLKGLRRMLVPFYSGRERPCRLVGTIGVDLPPGLEQGEEVRLRVHVDADKTLHWWFAVAGGDWQKPEPLLDPWAPTPPTGDERRLFELRREIRKKLVCRGEVDPQDTLAEASLLLNLDECEEAELLLEDLGEPDGALAGRWQNLKALLWSRRGNHEMACRHYEAALEYQPRSAVILGNLAVALKELGRNAKGVARCRAALTLNPGLLYVRTCLADLHRAMGDEDQAARELREALEIARRKAQERPEDATALNWVARILRELGAYDEAHEARAQAGAREKDARYGGDHTHRIAGPDSGYVWLPGMG